MIYDLSQYGVRYWSKSLIPLLSDCVTQEDKWNKKSDSVCKSLCLFGDFKSFFIFFFGDLLAWRGLTYNIPGFYFFGFVLFVVCLFFKAFFHENNLFVSLFWFLDREKTIGYHATLYLCEQPLVIGLLLPQVGNTLQMRQQDLFWNKLF